MNKPAVALFWLLTACAFPAAAGVTLDKILAKGELRCGVSQNLPGFAVSDADDHWQGLHVDFCRALAAVVLGNPDKAQMVPLSSANRFAELQAGRVDVLAHAATVSFANEAATGLAFAGVYFFDGHSLLVARASGVDRIEKLDGATVCVEKGGESVLAEASQSRKLKTTALALDRLTELGAALLAGRCQAVLADRSKLAGLRLSAPDKLAILPDYLSKEPMGPAVRRGDEDWRILVRWVLFALLEAEERGINQAEVRHLRESIEDGAARRFLVDSGQIGASLKLAPDWVVRAVAAVGHYGEIYERNLGEASPLKLERGYNRLWKDGGLLYSPPFK